MRNVPIEDRGGAIKGINLGPVWGAKVGFGSPSKHGKMEWEGRYGGPKSGLRALKGAEKKAKSD